MEYRYYMGRIKLKKIFQGKKKGIYESMEFGKMGSNKVGYKLTFPGEQNIVPIRLCRKSSDYGKTPEIKPE